ncbi:hypothetical protein F7725_025284, partial [Dissostichus mawsoni]
MAASGGGLSPPATVAGLSIQAPARARFPGRPCTVRSRLRSEKRIKCGRLGSDDGDLASEGPRPVNIGLALSEDPALLRLLGVWEKHSKQRDAGFMSSEEEEDVFTGFGTTTASPQKAPRSSLLSRAKLPPASDRSLEAKPLLGKIIHKSPKSSLIGKIVSRVPKEDHGFIESPSKDQDIPKVLIKLHGKQVAPTVVAKHAGAQASDRQSSTRAADFIRRAGKSAYSRNMRNQTAATSAGGTRQASKVKEPGEVSEDSDTDQSQPQRSVKRMIGHTRRTSQAAALSFTSFQKRQRRRMAKGMGASPEAGAEAQSGDEAAMPLECKATDSPEKGILKRQRKSLYGHKRKPKPNDLPKVRLPKVRRIRTRRVFYTYVTEPISAPLTPGGNQQQLQSQSITPSEGDPNTSTTVTSGRSSRVIKTPKRFLDEEMIPFPKGSLATWQKSQQREDGKPSPSYHDSSYDGNSLQSDCDSTSVTDSPSAKFPSKPRPGTSHLEIYKNLKKLTLKLAEKKKGHSDTEGSYQQSGDGLTSHVRKKRRSKLMMEEMDAPGVVRKLAVLVNADVAAPSSTPSGDTGSNNEAGGVPGESNEAVEVSGPSYRIGLSGANKTMLHLLKKAKVQLIKIDQQKQLKMSQLGSGESRVPVTRRRRRRVGLSPKDKSSEEQPLGGPRIKHVCRAAAVALGQPRALVPDDIPRLSALPLHEREGITFSPAAEDVADDDDEMPDPGRDQWITSRGGGGAGEGEGGAKCSGRRRPRSAPGAVDAEGCLIEEDCAECINCLDKPKFGGPNTKRQCCVYRKCDRIEKAKMDRVIKPLKLKARHFLRPVSGSEDTSWKSRVAAEGSSSKAPGLRKHSLRNITPRSYSSLLKSESEDEEGVEEKYKADKSPVKTAVASDNKQEVRTKHLHSRIRIVSFLKMEERYQATLRLRCRSLAGCSPEDLGPNPELTRVCIREQPDWVNQRFPPKGLLQNKYKIRVDFKEDCAVQNVWLMGGLSVLTSVPTTPQPVCLLCASKGRHE